MDIAVQDDDVRILFSQLGQGLAESLAVWKLSTGWSEAVAFVILFAFILARPSGLFGSKARV